MTPSHMQLAAVSMPDLAEKIKGLQGEHATIQSQLSEIVTRLERVLPDDLEAFNELCTRLTKALSVLDKHTQTENRLIQEAVSQDTGGEGGA